MLVAVRRSLPSSTEISLEIPSGPIAAVSSLPVATRTLHAKVLRIQLGQNFNLIGLKFSQPLVASANGKLKKRKRTAVA
jgi:hypothetical protein